MKYLFLITSLLLTLSIYANEINSENYPLIKPVSVEKVSLSEKDTDKDGVTDDKDKCPDTKPGAEVDAVGCEIIYDGDSDGVVDADDKCPNTRDGAVVNAIGCEPDNDMDGIPDSVDECPDTAEGFKVDEVGCPQTAILKINFDVDEYNVTPENLPKIEEFASFLQENPNYNAIIYGHTDITGSYEHNEKLSINRANAVLDTLVDLGIEVSRLSAMGMGSKDPVADNDTPEGLAENRRIEVELLQIENKEY